ncbi:MAG: chloride channel protein, partial [Anaerolineae bacterium]
EVILGKFTVRYFGAVVMSSVAASIVGRAFLGDKPAFTVPAYPLNHLGELGIYAVLGVLSALAAVLFIRLLYLLEGRFDEWRLPLPVKTAVGLALTAGVALLLPGREVLGPGLDFIGEAIAEDFSLTMGLMGALLVLKLLATSFTLGSGNSGGVFAPALFMGAILGGMVGAAAHQLWPEVAINPGAYAIVGMAAVFAGAAHAPITAVLIVFEMSNDYKLILPLMLTTVLSTLLAEHIFSESIYTLKLKLKGISLERGRDLDLLQSILVREAMTKDVYVVQEDMPLEQLDRYFHQTHAHSFPVVDGDMNLMGMVSLRDYDRAMKMPDHEQIQVNDIATTGGLLVAFEDEPLSDALRRIGTRGVNKLPVVTRENPRRVLGVVRRRDLVKAYNLALTRRMKSTIDEEAMKLRRTDETEYLEIRIPENGRAAHRTLASLAPDLPQDSVIVSLRRHGNLFIPHGNTVLLPGDMVNVFLRYAEEDKLRNCLLGKKKLSEKK